MVYGPAPDDGYGDPVYAPSHEPAEPLRPPGFASRPPTPTPAEPKRRFWTAPRIVLSVVLLLAVCAGGVYALTRLTGGEGPRVKLPETFAGYARLHNGTDASLRKRLAGQAGVAGLGDAIFGHASIGAYARNTGDQPALIVFALPHRSLAALTSDDHDAATRALLSGAVDDARTYAAGPHGGVLRCGSALAEDVPLSACAWSDDDNGGLLIVGYPHLTVQRTATLTNELRDALR